MTEQPRPYEGPADLEAMKALVIEGYHAAPDAGYPHPGDLDWWLYYGAPSRGQPLHEIVQLWHDSSGRLNGWLFMNGCEFDLAVRPELRGMAPERAIVEWAEAHLTPHAIQQGKVVATAAWRNDTALCALLEARGYTGSDYLIAFTRSLEGTLPQPQLPEGFTFLKRMQPDDADRRADAHFNAFQNSRMTPAAYRHFMQAPGYDPELDVVVVAPDGRFAAYAMCWVDTANCVGSFEPVGTRKDMQRQGLGKAALLEGMHRMQARGMQTVSVLTWIKDAGNIAFYKTVGFNPINVWKRYEKQPAQGAET